MMFDTIRLESIEKFLVVGDCHLNYQTPASRIDNYAETCLNKLQSLLDIAVKNEDKLVIFLGDVFHKPTQPIEFMSKVIAQLRKFQENGITCVSCVGNHDIARDSLDYLPSSALNIVAEAGVMLLPKRVVLKDRVITFYAYPENLENATSTKDVCVAHRFFENSFTVSSLTKALCTNLGYSLYLLGHDHEYYKPVKESSYTVIRPGSFTRGTSHQYNLERQVAVTQVEITDQSYIIKEFPIAQKSAKEVFTETVFAEKQVVEDKLDVRDQLNYLIKQMDTKIESGNVYTILDRMDLKSEVRKKIEEYLYSKGVLRASK